MQSDCSTLFPYTTLFRSYTVNVSTDGPFTIELWPAAVIRPNGTFEAATAGAIANCDLTLVDGGAVSSDKVAGDRKSTRLNSSHSQISYAVFCLKNKRRPQ